MDTLRDTAEAIETAIHLARHGLPESPQAIEAAQRALRDTGLYAGAIDRDAGPMTRIAYACAVAATREQQHQMWCYEDRAPKSPEDADAWARSLLDMGLDGACVMVSSAADNLEGVWRFRSDRVRYVMAAEAARRHGLGVSLMPWVRPLRGYTEQMLRDVVALCEDAEVDRVDLDHEFGIRWRRDMTTEEMAERVVSHLALHGISVLASSYSGRSIEGDGNDDIDPYREHLIRATKQGVPCGWSPQEYSTRPGYKGRTSDVYAPGNMQRYAYRRWNIERDREHGLSYWPGLAAYEQAGRPGYTAATHFGDAWATQIEHGADGSIIWTRRWLLQEADVRGQVRSIADRRAHFRQLAGLS